MVRRRHPRRRVHRPLDRPPPPRARPEPAGRADREGGGRVRRVRPQRRLRDDEDRPQPPPDDARPRGRADPRRPRGRRGRGAGPGRETVEREGIDCELRYGGLLTVATNDAQARKLGRELDRGGPARPEDHPRHRWRGGAGLRPLTHLPHGAVGGAFRGPPHPAKLARGLADSVVRKGAALFARGPGRRRSSTRATGCGSTPSPVRSTPSRPSSPRTRGRPATRRSPAG